MRTFLRYKDITVFHLKSLTWVVHCVIVFIHRFIIPDGDFETLNFPVWVLMRYRTRIPTEDLTGTCGATGCRGGGSAGSWSEAAARVCRVQGTGWSEAAAHHCRAGPAERAPSLADFLGKQVFNREHPASLDTFKVYS